MSSPIEMLVDGKLAYWQFRAIGTQTGSGGSATVQFTPGVGNFFIIDTLRVGADDYDAGNNLFVTTEDEDNNSTLFILGASLDNARSFIPSQNVTDEDTLTDNKMRYIVISGDDKLDINLQGLLVDETLTVALRCYISSTVPTVTFSTSGGTIPVSTTLNKVVV